MSLTDQDMLGVLVSDLREAGGAMLKLIAGIALVALSRRRTPQETPKVKPIVRTRVSARPVRVRTRDPFKMGRRDVDV